jgi:hypothetical protein
MDSIKLISIVVIVIVVIILISVYTNLFTTSNNSGNSIETFSEESINNIASVYNEGKMTVSNLTTTQSFNLLPRGMIMAWNGSINNIPYGWVICDGTNGTPDLRAKFLIGANPSGSSNGQMSIAPETNGGNSQSWLIAQNLPPHAHYFTSWAYATGAGDTGYPVVAVNTSWANTPFTNTGGNSTTANYGTDYKGTPWGLGVGEGNPFVTGNPKVEATTEGVQQPISIIPPYYSVIWIMKT